MQGMESVIIIHLGEFKVSGYGSKALLKLQYQQNEKFKLK